MTDEVLIPVARIEKSIYLIRGHKVILDRDLAAPYFCSAADPMLWVRREGARL